MSSKKKIPAYLISASGAVTVVMDGKSYTAQPSHASYAKIRDAIKAKQWSKLPKLFDVGVALAKRSRNTLKLKNGKVYYGDSELHNVVVDRILKFMNEGLDFKPLYNFLRRLVKNPSQNSVEQLYKFMEANDLAITWDGYLLAYKKVRSDHKDFYSGTFDNSVGVTVKMPRADVVDDPNVACHRGLHVGGLSYARDSFNVGEGIILLVKVDPANVVSVPNDYGHGKCRVCEYEVLSDYHVYEEATKSVKPEPVKHEEAMGYGRADDEEDDDDEICDGCGKYLDDCSCEDDDEIDDYE